MASLDDFDYLDVYETPSKNKSWRFDTIYRRLENNKKSFWAIGYDAKKQKLLIQTGQVGGKTQYFEHDIEPNIQLKTHHAKAIVDARTLFNKKTRKGYTRNIDTKMAIHKPQLAKVYPTAAKLQDKHFQAGVACQPKLDGIRAISTLKEGQVSMTTREGIQHEFLEELKEEVLVFLHFLPPDVALDAELMLPDGDFTELQSAVRGTKNRGKRNNEVNLYVFDLITSGVLEDRTNLLLDSYQVFTQENPDLHRIRLIRSEYAHETKTLESYYEQYLAWGYEGMMMRKCFGGDFALEKQSLYTNYRNANLLKYKPFDDSEAVIVDIFPGKNKDKDKAIFKLRMEDDQEFTLKPGTDQERIEYLEYAERYIGRIVTYKHQGFFPSGQPRFPVWLRFRDVK